MSLSPTQLTLRKLRDEGWRAEVTERWNPHSQTRHDLFGILDVVALKDGVTLGVQCTSASNVSARVHKIADSDALPLLREAQWKLECWGWSKGPNGRWRVRVVDVS